MKAIKITATIDEYGQLTLDRPLMTEKNSRVEVIVLIPEEVEIEENDKSKEETEIEEDDKSKEEILEDFRQAWHEAMTGQTIPVTQLWEGLDDV